MRSTATASGFVRRFNLGVRYGNKRFKGLQQTLIRFASTSRLPPLDLLAIDRKWQAKWAEADRAKEKNAGKHIGVGSPGSERPKSYICSMFPYPSGSLHMGHLRVYTISDVLARFYRMRGHDVLHPIGWDAFGLPAENAAIERGINPADWTVSNIERMKSQLRSIGADFDWDRELMTCSPEFYKHTQMIFLMMYQKGLAYQAEALVNYDPVDKTVLANEQVDANGYSWRSGAKVQQVKLKQWFLRITAFREALLNDLDSLASGWPERVLSMQRNWLGRSVGAKIRFPITAGGENRTVQVFTTRPDTLYGVEYLALSLDHPIVVDAAKSDSELKKFLDRAASLPPDSKEGYRLTNVTASHPLRNIDKESATIARDLPVYVAPYVLSDYGEGAVMGVPAHDSRDLAFFKQNLRPEFVTMVVQPESSAADEASSSVPASDAKAYTQEGYLTSRCGKYRGLHSQEAARQIVGDLEKIGYAEFSETWRLRDWLISRQRHWGTPIPIIHCGDCGPVPVPVDQLPVTLPKIEGDWLKGKKGNPLESAHDWVHTQCPQCGGPAKRDTDTMDTFVDSSWYYLRYLDPKNENVPFSSATVRPVDIYIGGVEHAILHLLYARFVYKFLAQSELFPEAASAGGDTPAEPFRKLISQGMVHGKTYMDPSTGRFLLPSEVDLTDPQKPVIRGTNVTPNISFEKMSKSKHNGVDPMICVDKYGADATRAHVLFAAPVDDVLEWDDTKIVGMQRWFARVWKLVSETGTRLPSEPSVSVPAPNSPLPPQLLTAANDRDATALLATHQTITSVTRSIETNPYGLNTVVSDLTKLTNTLAPSSSLSPTVQYITTSTLLRLLFPIAPALASECWEVLHDPALPATQAIESSIDKTPWPSPLLTEEQEQHLSSLSTTQTVAVQINGKLRFRVNIPQFSSSTSGSTTEQDWVIDHILETNEGKLWLTEKNDWEKRKRVVVVPGGRVVNVVF